MADQCPGCASLRAALERLCAVYGAGRLPSGAAAWTVESRNSCGYLDEDALRRQNDAWTAALDALEAAPAERTKECRATVEAVLDIDADWLRNWQRVIPQVRNEFCKRIGGSLSDSLGIMAARALDALARAKITDAEQQSAVCAPASVVDAVRAWQQDDAWEQCRELASNTLNNDLSVALLDMLMTARLRPESDVRREERERCAAVAEAEELVSGSPGPLFNWGWDAARKRIAAAIRAMEDTDA